MMSKIIVFMLSKSIKGIIPRNTEPIVIAALIIVIMMNGREITKVMIGGISPKTCCSFVPEKLQAQLNLR